MLKKNIVLKIVICTIILSLTISCKDKKSVSNEGSGQKEMSQIDADQFKDMVLIPAGEFVMGNDMKNEDTSGKKKFMKKPLYADEYPKRKVFVDAFYIDKFEITNKKYKTFADEAQLDPLPDNWKDGTFPEGRGDHPVNYVNWYYAMYYARWAGKRLPTEAEWEKAARGTDGRLWTWGNEFDSEKGNFGLNKIKDTSVVGKFPGDMSPFGLFDVTGNVKEWTVDWYTSYPDNDFTFADFGRKYKVVRGSSHIKSGHYYDKSFAMVTHRFYLDPRIVAGDVGFRCVKDVDEKEES